MEKIQIVYNIIINIKLIIKPSPENIKQTYLKSLSAIGIQSKDHDIRFVEDDWESPTGSCRIRLGSLV